MPAWLAHDHPERPLAYGAWLCACSRCELALRAAARLDPGLVLVVKGASGRRRHLASDWLAGGRLHPSAGRVVEVFVADQRDDQSAG